MTYKWRRGIDACGLGHQKEVLMEVKRLLKIIAIALALLAVATVVIIVFTNNNEKDEYRLIKVKSFEGVVELQRGFDNNSIFEGMNLMSGDTVTTQQASLVELLADSDKHIIAEENTCFSILASGNEKRGKIKIDLLYGTSLFEIENKLSEGSEFEVDTPNATLSVRGTTFKVNYDKKTNTTIVEVLEGIVEVASATEIKAVEAGQMITVTGIEGVMSDGNSDTENPNTGSNEDAVELVCGDDVAFFLVDWDQDKDMRFAVYSLEGWRPEPRSVDDEIVYEHKKDGIIVRYSVITNGEFNDAVDSKKQSGQVMYMDNLVNGEGDEVIALSCDYNGQNGDISHGLEYYRSINDEYYLALLIYDEDGGASLENVALSSYLDFTSKVLYLYEFKDSDANTTEGNPSYGGTDIGYDEWADTFNVNYEQLTYLIEIAQQCYEGANENYVALALNKIWYLPELDNVYKPIEGKQLTYNIEQLNNLFSLLTDDKINENNKAPVSEINGNELIYKPCDVSEGDYLSAEIEGITYGDGDEILVRYNFEMTYGSDGMRGIKGTSVAHFAPRVAGGYKLHHIEGVSRENFER